MPAGNGDVATFMISGLSPMFKNGDVVIGIPMSSGQIYSGRRISSNFNDVDASGVAQRLDRYDNPTYYTA